MSEAAAYKRLKEYVCRPRDRFQRIENGLGAGMPDVNYCIMGVEGWIEIKQPDEPKRPTTPLLHSQHQVSVEQANWLLAQAQAGGVGWLFIATKQRLLFIPGAEVGRRGIRINQMTVHQLEGISSWKTLVPVMDQRRWADLRELLTTTDPYPTYPTE